MLIGKEYRIESDSMNITLYERKINKKTREEYWYALGYFATVQGALHELVNLKVRETGLKDLKTVVKKQDELYHLIESLNLRRDAVAN